MNFVLLALLTSIRLYYPIYKTTITRHFYKFLDIVDPAAYVYRITNNYLLWILSYHPPNTSKTVEPTNFIDLISTPEEVLPKSIADSVSCPEEVGFNFRKVLILPLVQLRLCLFLSQCLHTLTHLYLMSLRSSHTYQCHMLILRKWYNLTTIILVVPFLNEGPRTHILS